jgi:ABC-2 type transport system ATP-binding protein
MGPQQQPILKVDQACQAYRTGFWMKRTEILHSVSLAVPERSVFGFLGPNGAGKTTLIQLIVGLREPTSGSVSVGGYPATSPEARANVGYLPERPYFYDHLTGEQLLIYFGTLSGLSRKQILDRIPQVLDSVGMSHARHRELRKYSKGMLQRIGIAQAILHNPRFLVLDEPMSGLDPLGRKEMRELILKLASEGRTIFFSSHVIPDVEAICDQVAVIQKGKIVGSGLISSFLESKEAMAEIGFSGLALQEARSVFAFDSAREMPDGIRATVRDQENQLNGAIQAVLSRGGRILWVTPMRPSLESFFENPVGARQTDQFEKDLPRV